jgi:hypothetical protein
MRAVLKTLRCTGGLMERGSRVLAGIERYVD